MKKREKRKFHQDNRGGTMVMVLVIIAFIGILSGILLYASYGGYQMRLADKQGKDNFYTAETVLDEINVGLQEEISKALKKSYEQVMVNYALYETEEKRSREFYNVYYTELQNALQQDAAHPNLYNINMLRGYLSAEVKGDGTDGSRENFGTYGAIVESNVETAPAVYTLALKENGIVLKDLKVSYVNKSGYVSIISTDIRIALPAVNFAQTSAFPDVNGYCLIADEKLALGNTFAGGSITVKGDAYGGRLTLGKSDDSSILSSTIHFEKADGAEADSLSKIVSREDITLTESTLFANETEIWGNNLLLSSASATIKGSANLNDDLVLEGSGSEVVLSGEYTGFGISGKEAASNSAIVVNGKDSRLDLTGLESMNISGRAYVAAPKTEDNKDAADAVMGESVAVKSNQLIYLVPPEALGCEIQADGTVGASAYGCNPLRQEQYEEIITNPSRYVLLDGTKEVAALGYKSLSNYINREPVAGGENAYVPEVIFKQTNAGTLVYCYLRFKDEEAANRYFRDYYNVNTEKINAYTRLYAKEIKMASADTMLYLNLAGNMLAYAGQETAQVVKATDSYADKKKAQVVSVTKSDIFKALSAKLVTNIAQLSAEEQGQTAFTNIIYRAKAEEIIKKLDTFGTGTVQIDTENPGNIKTVILTKQDYVVDSSTPDAVHMIIALGNVTVKRDFQGLIISAKNITVTDSADTDHQVVIEPLTLEDFTEMLLAKATVSGKEYYILDVFQDGINYAYSENTIKDMGTKEVAMGDLIVYERWSKK